MVAKTDPAKGAKGTSLIVVDTSMKGFTKGKRLKKMGLKGQDTAELFFDNVEVPAENLLGQENNGFIYLMQELPWERMQIAIGAAAKCEAALGWTIAYVNDRKAFGKPVSSFQNTRFKLAEIATEVQVMRVFVDRCMELLLEKKLDTATASMAKLLGHRHGGQGASTNACSCTAATASCGNSRSRRPTWTRACSASTAAPTKS